MATTQTSEPPRALRAQSELAQLSERGSFLVWAAVCCGVFVAIATDVMWGRGVAVQAATAVLALLLGLAVAFAIPYVGLWASAASPEPVIAEPAPVRSFSTPAAPPAPAVPAPDRRHDELLGRLRLGESLRERFEIDPADHAALGFAVDDWIAATRRALELQAPSFAPYFASLAAQRELADDPRLRLERHLARLQTIVHDSL